MFKYWLALGIIGAVWIRLAFDFFIQTESIFLIQGAFLTVGILAVVALGCVLIRVGLWYLREVRKCQKRRCLIRSQ